MDASVASVFDDTKDSTGYHWDEASEFDSSDFDLDEQFKVRMRVSDLKHALDTEQNPQNPKNIWHSTPQAVAMATEEKIPSQPHSHSHRMSGSTIGNDFSGKVGSISKLDQVNELEDTNEQNESQVETLQDPEEANLHGKAAEQDLREDFERNFEQQGMPQTEDDDGEVQSSPSPQPDSAYTEPQAPATVKPHLISTINSLPERQRNEVMNYISASLSHKPVAEPQEVKGNEQKLKQDQDQADRDQDSRESTADELEKLKEYLRNTKYGQTLLDGFSSQQDILPKTKPINASSLPNKSLYNTLEMERVERLDRIELENTVKNILLQFGIPFSKLPLAISAIAKTLGQEDYCREFACRVHELLYDEPMMCINKQCLDKMLERLNAM